MSKCECVLWKYVCAMRARTSDLKQACQEESPAVLFVAWTQPLKVEGKREPHTGLVAGKGEAHSRKSSKARVGLQGGTVGGELGSSRGEPSLAPQLCSDFGLCLKNPWESTKDVVPQSDLIESFTHTPSAPCISVTKKCPHLLTCNNAHRDSRSCSQYSHIFSDDAHRVSLAHCFSCVPKTTHFRVVSRIPDSSGIGDKPASMSACKTSAFMEPTSGSLEYHFH